MNLLPGTRLGRYQIGARIGAGGMGEVYQARDERLGRDVAIKVLAGPFGDAADLRLRFEREAKAAARLSHPNIVAIHDVGEDAGVAYAVMELLRGETLRDRLRAGPLPTDLVREYALQVARALAAAHAQGIVHRDLKPENIFLSAGGAVKLLDFGIARVQDALSPDPAEAQTSLGTSVGTLLGTVEYMSPEQVRAAPVDHRTDVFSFGIVLFEMLTGARPFTGGSTAELAASILMTEAPPIGTAATGEAARLERIARRCLEKQPADRFASAQELEEALGAPTGDPEAPAPEHSPATGSDGATGAVAATAATTPTRAADGRRSVAVLPFVDLSLDRSLEFFCDGVAEEILNALSRVPGLRVTARSSAFQFKGRSDDVRNVGKALNVGTVLEGSVRAAGRRLRINAHLVDAAEGYQVWSERFDRELDDIFAVQDEIARAVVHALAVPRAGTALTDALGAGTTDIEAYTLYLKGRHHWNKRTEVDLEAGRSYFAQAIARDPEYAEAHGALALTCVTLGLYGARAPREVMPLARSTAEAALALQSSLPSALAAAACVDAVYDWDWDASEARFRTAIDASPDAPAPHHWYAINCLVPQRRFAEAGRELELALKADPLSPAIVATIGFRAYFAREYAEAERELRKALALHSNFAMAHLFLGLTCLDAGRQDEARREIETAGALADGSPEMISALGYVHARAGDQSAARGALDTLVTLAGERYVSPVLVAQLHCALGEHELALTWLERARDARAADLAWVPVRSVWDPLRASARFQAILQAMHLSTEGPASAVP
jgi:serine/threonine-protein kinase